MPRFKKAGLPGRSEDSQGCNKTLGSSINKTVLFKTKPTMPRCIDKGNETKNELIKAKLPVPGPVDRTAIAKVAKNQTEPKDEVDNQGEALKLINNTNQLDEFITAVEEMKLCLFIKYGLVIVPLTSDEGEKISYLLICTKYCFYAIDFLLLDLKTLKILNKIFQNEEITISIRDENTAALLDKYNLFPTRVCVIRKLEKLTDTFITPVTCNIDWGRRPIFMHQLSRNVLEIVRPVLNFLDFAKELVADIKPIDLPLLPFIDHHEYSVKLFQDRYYVECVERYFPNIMALSAQQQNLLNRLLQWRCLLSTVINKPEATAIPIKFIQEFVLNSSKLPDELFLSKVHQIEWMDMSEESKLAFGPNYKPGTIKREQNKVKIVAGKFGRGLMIAKRDELEDLIKILKIEKEIGVHAVFGCKFYSVVETLSFLVIATRNEVYLIDFYNLNTKTLQILQEVFLSDDIIKIFYNSSKIKPLLEDYNLHFRNIFDVMENSKNLYYEGDMIQIIEERFPGRNEVCKSKHDWTARPLKDYARECLVFVMKYLPKLYTILKTEMFENDLIVNLLDILPECRRLKSKFCNDGKSLHLTPGQQYALIKLDEWRNFMAERKKVKCELILPDHLLEQVIKSLHTVTWFESLSTTGHLDSFHKRNMKKEVVQILKTARSVIGPKFELVQKSDPRTNRQCPDKSPQKIETITTNADSGEMIIEFEGNRRKYQLELDKVFREVYDVPFSNIHTAGEQYTLKKLEEWRRFTATAKNTHYSAVLSDDDMNMLIHTATSDCDPKTIHARFPNMSIEEARDISNILLTTSKSVCGPGFSNTREPDDISSQNLETVRTSTGVGQKRPHKFIAEPTDDSTKKMKTDNLTDCQKYIVERLENWKIRQHAAGEICYLPYHKMITLSENLQLYSKGAVNLLKNLSWACSGTTRAGLREISEILLIAKLAFDPKLTFAPHSNASNEPNFEFGSLKLRGKPERTLVRLEELRCSIGEARGVDKQCIIPNWALNELLKYRTGKNVVSVLNLCPNLTEDIAVEIAKILGIYKPVKFKKDKRKLTLANLANFKPARGAITLNVDQEAPNNNMDVGVNSNVNLHLSNDTLGNNIVINQTNSVDCQKYIVEKLENWKTMKHAAGEPCNLPYDKMVTLSNNLQLLYSKDVDFLQRNLSKECPGTTIAGLREIARILLTAKLAFDPKLTFSAHSDAFNHPYYGLSSWKVSKRVEKILFRLEELRCSIGEARSVDKRCILPDCAFKELIQHRRKVNITTVRNLCPNLTEDIAAEVINIAGIKKRGRFGMDKTKLTFANLLNFKSARGAITLNVDQEASNNVDAVEVNSNRNLHFSTNDTHMATEKTNIVNNERILKSEITSTCTLQQHQQQLINSDTLTVRIKEEKADVVNEDISEKTITTDEENFSNKFPKIKHEIEELTDCQKYIIGKLENLKIMRHAAGEPFNLPYDKMVILSKHLQLCLKQAENLLENLLKQCPGYTSTCLREISRILFIAKLAFDPQLTFVAHSGASNEPNFDFANSELTRTIGESCLEIDELRCSIGEARGVDKRCILPDNALKAILELPNNRAKIMSVCPNLTKDIVSEIKNIIKYYRSRKALWSLRATGTRVDQEAPNRETTTNVDIAVNYCNVNLHIYNNALCNNVAIKTTNIVDNNRIIKPEITSTSTCTLQNINSDTPTLRIKQEKSDVANEDTLNIKQEFVEKTIIIDEETLQNINSDSPTLRIKQEKSDVANEDTPNIKQEFLEKTIIIDLTEENSCDNAPKIKQEINDDEDTDTEFDEPMTLRNESQEKEPEDRADIKREIEDEDSSTDCEDLDMHQDRDVQEEHINVESEKRDNLDETYRLEEKLPENRSSICESGEEKSGNESLHSFLNRIDFESGMFDDYC